MALDVDGILQNFSLANEQVTVLYPYLREVFINEAPLFSRLPMEVADGQHYNIVGYDVRPRTYTLNAAIIAGDTSITLVDATPLMVGDVLEMFVTGGASTERIEVTGDPTATTVAIRRAREGTSAVANDNTGNKTLTLIGNSRTGAEIDQTGNRSVRWLIPQDVQTFTSPVQIGGLANAVRNTRLPPGISNVFTLEQKVKMTEMVRDIEYASYFGKGEAVAATGDRAKMKGLKALIGYYNGGATPAAGSNTNVKTNGGASYTFLNFVADAVQKCIDGGGNPDTVLCSTGFATGLATWGFAKQQMIEPNYTKIGTPIDGITIPIAGKPINFVPSFQLKEPGNSNHLAMVLTSTDLKMRFIREASWRARGVRGDAQEGEYFGDYCIEAGHPGWHSYVSGISSFA